MRVFHNKLMIIDYDQERSYFKVIRRGYDNEYTEEEYKDLMLSWRKQIEIFKPVYQMVDYQNFFKPVPLHMQKWINENLLAPSLKVGLKKIAFIISRDLYAQISVEQIMQEDEGKNFIVKYFDNETDAEKWLFQQN